MIVMNQDEARERLLFLSERAATEGEPLRWFEELYSGANRDWEEIPWADLQPNPVMIKWLEGRGISGRSLVVGCGLGDDAVWLSEIGFEVVAFDISQSCIDWCKERFPDSGVDWRVADLLTPPDEWFGTFDLVVEIHILQAIPSGDIRDDAVANLSRLLSERGCLLCIGRLDDGGGLAVQPPPWPLKQSWLVGSFPNLTQVSFESFVLPETPEVTRFVAAWSGDASSIS